MLRNFKNVILYKHSTLKAGALLYAVFLSFLISLIAGFIVLSSYYHNRYIDNLQGQTKIIANVNSAINLILGAPETLQLNQKKNIDLFNDGENIVSVEGKSWGMYNVACASSTWHNYSFSKTAMFGDDIFNTEQVSLYLADQNNYLSLCGRTIVKGICYLPRLGTKRAYIEGQSFVGNKMVDGDVKTSEKQLPQINSELIEKNNSYLTGNFQKNDSIRYYEEFAVNDTIANSFNNKTLLILSDNKIQLSYKLYKGNIIIFSKNEVEIQSDARIEDIIVYAPSIKIKSGFKGNLQAFASDSLIVEDNVTLLFPSVTGLIGKTGDLRQYLKLESNCEVSGAVFLFSKSSSTKNQPVLSIDKNAVVYGQVYSNSLTELKGKIYGSLYCSKFLLKTPSSIYENHLLNAEVNFSKLSPQFVGVSLLEKSKQKELIKWLN